MQNLILQSLYIVCRLSICLFVCKFSHFSSPHLLCWPAPPSIHRGLEWPQCLNCSLIVLCLSVCLEANFLIFLLLTSSFIVLSPLLFIYKTSGSRHYGPAPSLAYGIHLDVLMS